MPSVLSTHGCRLPEAEGCRRGQPTGSRVIRFEIKRSWPVSTRKVRHAEQVRLLPHPD